MRQAGIAPPGPFFSVIVPTWNRASFLEKCLTCLRTQETSQEYEVILVDNGSQDRTIETFLTQASLPGGHRLKYFGLRETGSSLARNRGASVALGEWLVFTDDDCLPPISWLERAARKAQEGSGDSFGGPALAVPGAGSANWFPPELEDLNELAECNFFIRSKAFLEAGGFQEQGGPKGSQWRTHEGNKLFGRGGTGVAPSGMVYRELFIFHHLEGRRCRLGFRLYKKFMGGWAQGREKNGKKLIRPCLRLAWNLSSFPFIFLNGSWRKVGAWAEVPQFLCERGSAKIYRIGELAGEVFGDLWGKFKKIRSPGRSKFVQTFSRMLGRVRPPLLAPGQIPAGAHQIREGGWSSQPRSEVIFGRSHPWLAHGYLHFPAQWCLACRNVRVYGPSLGVITPKDGLISDVSVEWGRFPQEHFTRRRLILPRAQKVAGHSLILASTGGNTFFHWMLDVLPRMEIARQAGQPPKKYDHVLVNSLRMAFQKESLQLLGIPADRCLALDLAPAWELASATLPSLPGIPGVPRKSSILFLRELFLGDAPAPGARKRIFISREGSPHRRLQDQGELWNRLRKLGFEKFEGAETSVKDQAKVFQSAQMVVAVHGAALTNLVFCQPNTVVLELFSPAYVNPCYRDLCHVAGLKHRAAILGQEAPVEWSHDHPSCDLTPTAEDTRKIEAWVAGQLGSL